MTVLSPVLDTHLHYWDQSLRAYPWLSSGEAEPFFVDVKALPNSYVPADYLNDAAAANVVPFVHVEAGCRPEDAIDETSWVGSLTRLPGGPDRLVVYADLARDDVDAVLDAHQTASPDVVGVRQIVTWHPDPKLSFVPDNLLLDPLWQRGLSALESRGLSLDIQIYPGQVEGALQIARRQTGLSLLINHGGFPIEWDSDQFQSWRSAMTSLATCENVAIKIGGFAMVRRGWTPAEVVPVIRQAIEIFGPDRCMFASNYPVERVSHTMGTLRATWEEAIHPYNSDEQADLRSGSAKHWYRPRPTD